VPVPHTPYLRIAMNTYFLTSYNGSQFISSDKLSFYEREDWRMKNRNSKRRRREIVVRLRIKSNDGDIKEILDNLDKIKKNMEEGRKFTFRSVFGAFCITMGFGLIGFTVAFFSLKHNINDMIYGVGYGVLMLFVGAVILARGYIIYRR
jgi:hypothetical protein